MDKQYLIGVDGGGTRTTCVAARMDGTVVKRAVGQGINYNNIGMDEARRRLFDTVEKLLDDGGKIRSMCIGMSALDYAADEETTRLFCGDAFDPRCTDMQSDAYTALVGYTLGKPGMLIICGTGSMTLMLDGKGKQTVTGGWGHILGDPGSSHQIAMDALRLSIGHWEGIHHAPALAAAAEKHFDLSHPRQLIDRVFAPDCTPDVIAGFAKDVLILAAEGDTDALSVLKNNMEHCAAQCAALLEKAPEAANVGLHGGVFTHNLLARQLFTQALQKRVPHAKTGMALFPPELGALIHLFAKENKLTEKVLDNLKTSYEKF